MNIKHPRLKMIELLLCLPLLLSTFPVCGLLWIGHKYIQVINYFTSKFFEDEQ